MAVSCPPSTAILRKNLIINCFNTLKKTDHFVKEGSSKTNYEAFWDKLNHGFSLSLRPYKPSNSAVEAFYRGTMPVDQFLFDVEENVIRKAQDKLDSNLDPLLTISWDVFCSYSYHKEFCEKISRLCGRQIWAIYNKLDIDSTGFVPIDDITELILKIFYCNGKTEDAKNIHEWFCEQSSVDFWSFFSALVQNHCHLLQLHVIQELYEEVVHEVLKQGRMVKKGHKVQTWKDRWFVLTSTNLYYYESLENRIQKGVVTINSNTKVTTLPTVKGRNYLFQVTDGVNNRPYDISAPDPQVLKDWVETIQVVVLAQSIQGRNLLHRLSLARDRLFPNHTRLPSYTPSASSPDYNEGIYRVVCPTSPVPKEPPRSPPPSSGTSTSISELPSSGARNTLDIIPLNGSLVTSTPIHQPAAERTPQMEAAQPVPQKRQGPPVAPYHKTSTSKIEHVNVDGHDYALVDKLLEGDQDEVTPPPLPKPRDSKGLPPEVKPYSSAQPLPPLPKARETSESLPPPLPKARETRAPENESMPPPPLPKPRETRTSESELLPPLPLSKSNRPTDGSQPPPPVPKTNNGRPFSPVNQPPLPIKDSGRPFSPVTGHLQHPLANDRAGNTPAQPPVPKSRGEDDLLQRPAPKPRNKLGPTKSVPATPYISPEGGSYAQLTFANMDGSPPTDDGNTVTNNKQLPHNHATQQPKIATSVARTKYDYSDVIVAPVVTKDIDKALELKANKPAPSMPPKYEPTKKNSASDSSLPSSLSTANETTPKPPHTYQNVHYTGGGGARNDEDEDEEEEEPPPPPVPRRLESYRTDSSELLPRPLSPSGPLPAPRSPRRQGVANSPSLPPLPPR